MLDAFKIHFVGGGNMADSLVGGLLAQGVNPAHIRVTELDSHKCERLQQSYQILASPDNLSDISQAEVVVLAVKPQVMPAVLEQMATQGLSQRTVVMSIAAGISVATIERYLARSGENCAVVRAMPNTPALIQQGMTVLFANEHVSPLQKQYVASIGHAVGHVDWVVSEDLLAAATAVSGSGPAYFFLLIESMVSAGLAQGLTEAQAFDWVLQTAQGAVALVGQKAAAPSELREQVTSPGGTTEAALAAFHQAGFEDIVKHAMLAAAERSLALAIASDKG